MEMTIRFSRILTIHNTIKKERLCLSFFMNKVKCRIKALTQIHQINSGNHVVRQMLPGDIVPRKPTFL